ncbi:MAG: FKBP-type peptidyl-prolyl cis-trans isomerase [Lachnospiraceae bacterium]|nr:FKBP-type peptidyl-prolyl cis-trans isomerase [Lachnospiraceae bacterium]
MSTNEKVTASSDVSKSKQKRIERQKKNDQVKREGVIGSVVGIFAIALIVGAVIFSVVASVRKSQENVQPNGDFGRYVNDKGMVEGIKASSIVTLPADYNNITIPLSEVEYTDAEFEEEKAAQLESHKVLNSETDKAIEDGDTVNIDYVGSIDGVEFEGGNSNGEGADLEIGSGTFIPGFEEQLIGHKNGEVFDIDVTFPEEYGNEELNGKDAVFNITVNGIYELGEFNDEFVAEKLKAYATTVDGYKKYISEKEYESRVKTYVSNYIDENSSLSKYPKKYLNQLKALKMYSDEQSYEYMNQMYQQFYGYGFSSFEEYNGMSQEDYLVEVEESAKESELTILALQAIAENDGITVSEDDIKAFVESVYGEGSYDSTLESYGKAYLAQTALQDKVGNYLVEKATIK